MVEGDLMPLFRKNRHQVGKRSAWIDDDVCTDYPGVVSRSKLL
ncbi:MAG: hypothetical protein OSB10_08245 [Planctomycetota bacterium]|nr:hypothetical protein [Planctomycetota bacterium]